MKSNQPKKGKNRGSKPNDTVFLILRIALRKKEPNDKRVKEKMIQNITTEDATAELGGVHNNFVLQTQTQTLQLFQLSFQFLCRWTFIVSTFLNTEYMTMTMTKFVLLHLSQLPMFFSMICKNIQTILCLSHLECHVCPCDRLAFLEILCYHLQRKFVVKKRVGPLQGKFVHMKIHHVCVCVILAKHNQSVKSEPPNKFGSGRHNYPKRTLRVFFHE